MNEAFDPPQGILNSKSVVLMDVPKEFKPDERIKLADQLQEFFSQEGIDAVAYFTVNSFNSITGMVEQIPEATLRRDIKNLIFLSVIDPEGDFVLGMGPFNGKNTFYDKGATFWVRQTNDLKLVFNELTSRFKTGAFPKENLLVNNVSEFVQPVVSGFREAYATLPDLKGKKIAIPTIDTKPMEKAGPMAINIEAIINPDQMKSILEAHKQSLNSLVAKDSVLFQIMEVENKNDSDLRRARVDYVLYAIQAEADNVYTFLPFKGREENKKGYLVKFFLRDTRSNNAYLGSEWDASNDWQSALNAFAIQLERAKAQNPN